MLEHRKTSQNCPVETRGPWPSKPLRTVDSRPETRIFARSTFCERQAGRLRSRPDQAARAASLGRGPERAEKSRKDGGKGARSGADLARSGLNRGSWTPWTIGPGLLARSPGRPREPARMAILAGYRPGWTRLGLFWAYPPVRRRVRLGASVRRFSQPSWLNLTPSFQRLSLALPDRLPRRPCERAGPGKARRRPLSGC